MKDESQLRGTFLLVMILGALIVACWMGFFELYLSR
jgi:hypothetical protein